MNLTSIKLTLRQLSRHKTYTVINVAGLALGLAAALLIMMYISDETSYDQFQEKGDRIYRVAWENGFGISGTPPLIPMDVAENELVGVEAGVNLNRAGYMALSSGNEVFTEDGFYYASNTFFNVFSFELRAGDPATALRAPYSVILTSEMAKKYFGEYEGADIVGKQLTSHTGDTFTVTGVLADPPGPSILEFDFLASFSSLKPDNPWNQGGPAFLLYDRPRDPKVLSADFNSTFTMDTLGWGVIGQKFRLEPLSELHLFSTVLVAGRLSDSLKYLYIFGGIALFLLLTAAINYMNLATARGLQRAREIGMRRTLGARRGQLLVQFLSEPVLLTVMSIVVAVGLMYGFLPTFNDLTGKSLSGSQIWINGIGPLFIIAALGVGLLSGLYPAFHLSRFQPATVLKSGGGSLKGGSRMRTGLVVFQFTLSVAVIAATMIIQSQLDFLQTKSLGYAEKDLITFRLRGEELGNWAELKDTIRNISGVESVSLASGTPIEAMISMHEIEGEEPFKFFHYYGDADYIETMGYELVAGRTFSEEMGTDEEEAIIVNQAAVRRFGLEGDPVGQMIDENTIIGVVKDFHAASLRSEISPAVIGMVGMQKSMLIVRVNPANIAGVLAGIELVWKERVPEYPFEYTFQDDKLIRQYSTEERLARFFGIFSFLVIVIACMGLFGLAAFMTERRTKEIGIRKVMGASVRQVVLLLSKEITYPVVVAIFLGAPIAYFAAEAWLGDFAYRISISPRTFLGAGALLLIVAWLTVSGRAVRAAIVNPVDSLRRD